MEYFEPERAERASLQALLVALDASPTALQRDLICGDIMTGVPRSARAGRCALSRAECKS
jgi:hypothetical protein